VHIMFTVLMFALATPYRQEETGGEPVGWRRWRSHILGQTRDMVIIVAGACHGVFHRAEYSLLLGVKPTDGPRGIGTRRQILAKYGLAAHR
jgi:hypothetical protein